MTNCIASKPPFEHANIKQRKCLDCRKEFTSEWNGHRICPKCKSQVHHNSASME